MDLLSGLDDYRAWLRMQMLSPCTVRQRIYFATGRLRDWGTLDVSRATIAEWLLQHAGWTRRTYINHLHSLYDWAVEAGHVPAHPVRGIKAPRTPKPRPKPLSPAEVRLVLEAAQGDLYVWLQLGRLQGLRAFEIAKIHGRDVDEQTLFVRGKAGGEHTLPTHPAIWRLAQDYPRDDFWFPSRYKYREHASESHVGNHVRDHFREMGIPSGSIHRMRHTYATELRRAGADTALIQQLMRHANLNTTEVYLQVVTNELESAIRLLAE